MLDDIIGILIMIVVLLAAVLLFVLIVQLFRGDLCMNRQEQEVSMAHGDYDCCAVCDRKMAFVWGGGTTKEQICSRCVAELATRGVIVHDVEELLHWMASEEPEKVLSVLDEVGFEKCHYDNLVDKFYDHLKRFTNDRKDRS